MRHDWTLLCAEVTYPPQGSIALRNVVTAFTVAERYRKLQSEIVLSLDDLPVWIVSQWTAEFKADRKLHSGVLQLLAPGGERVLREDNIEFDLRDRRVFRMIHRVPDITFVGLGTYEFHVVLEEFASVGEWGRACVILR